MNAPTLFDTASARASHPETSHAAARSVNVTKGQRIVLELLESLSGPVTHEHLVNIAQARGVRISPSGVRSRCHELHDKGYVRAAGETLTQSGRRAITWERSEP